ncbi:MAG: DNA polymerase III subunit alpha [Gallionellales bacterium 35-53-114]|jgi:DNA polymerase-3 subunit alpha|nr:MAG: DNA polymerase III subunit alpha [Gallionellales bacterium 35-53-114]OYZ64326.1 MAG: DNA polymerase III subunit alpha [Gallionellales bacterium 24-53-125]OZB10366.1 MAG: DNA polymerase III subunit alpha [Gallionellales bacterium 39-52-133]HQS56974.1 DNA polymerase III subunit alpha [Gallionellaceae bacterium]HQS75242.1 DNA polymerase III subunit alpha [Gallionellaceae bacterium]
MSQPAFIHLRLHSEYSIVDGIVRVGDAVEAAKRDGMPALALTDLNNIFGLVKFYLATRAKGIKPVMGCDVFVSNDAEREQPFRLLLLCQSSAGYLRLCDLLTRAYLENQYQGRPEIRKEWLQGGTEGLIALSGAQLGEVGTTLLNGNAASARILAQEYAGLFPSRFYLEVQRCGFAREETHVRETVNLAAELALPVVATHPVQFLSEDDFKAHEARVCIAEGYVLNDKRRVRAFTPQQYFKTQAEMAALFADLPEALANSVEIAKRCNLTLKLGKPYLPDFPTPNNISLDDFLRTESEEGLVQRMAVLYPDAQVRATRQEEYSSRLAFEIETIIKMGFPGYFLIVADFIRWAKRNGVPVGPGRGSGAGSLVAYSLGITDLDPLRYELLFERFLNPERVSMPDFDVDFCQDGRERVIEYVKQKYGAASVSQIVTFGTLSSKAVIRDVGRVMDFPYGLCDRLSKLVPLEGVKPVSLKKAREIEPEFNAIMGAEEGVSELLELCESLEDLTRNVGMHAGGVLISPGKLSDFCPLYCAEGSENAVSQFDKDDVEKVGLVKFDFLGLRTLTTIDWAVRYVNQMQAKTDASLPSFTVDNLPLDDKATYKLLKAANTTAVFQLESPGMKKLIVKLEPDTFEDIVALVALYRPGPLESGMVEDFINRKHGRAKADYFHPDLEVSLKPTYGVIVYQEQVMQIAQIIGGYSLGQADLLRRAMGKKNVDEMAEQRNIFVNGAVKREIDEKLATYLFDLMEKFAGYGFNKSHSAAYALVSYQTAYLKAHYPAAFMAATLSSDMDNTDKVHSNYDDTLAQKLTVLPPDINASDYRFAPVDEKTVAYGLGAIKGTGEAAIINIVAARNTGGPFKNIFDFCKRVDKRLVNRRSIEALIRGGAFDSISEHRHQIFASLDDALASAEQQARAANQNSLFGDDEGADMPVQMKEVPYWSLREKLQQEKTSLGFYLSGHPYQEFAEELAPFIKQRLADVTPQTLPQGGNNNRRASLAVLLAGMVADVRIQQTRRGRMAIVKIEDGSAQLEVTLFNELYEASRPWIKDGELLVVHGKATMDDYSGNMRVTGEEVMDLASARATFARRLDLGCAEQDASIVARLKELFTPYRGGKCPVVIHYRNQTGSAQLKLGEAWNVTLPDGLLSDLRGLLGEKNVRVVYG